MIRFTCRYYAQKRRFPQWLLRDAKIMLLLVRTCQTTSRVGLSVANVGVAARAHLSCLTPHTALFHIPMLIPIFCRANVLFRSAKSIRRVVQWHRESWQSSRLCMRGVPTTVYRSKTNRYPVKNEDYHSIHKIPNFRYKNTDWTSTPYFAGLLLQQARLFSLSRYPQPQGLLDLTLFSRTHAKEQAETLPLLVVTTSL